MCSQKLPEGSLKCGSCGAVYGEANRCPHCRTVADVEDHSSLRFRCRVCGGPRVPMDDSEVVRSGREIPLLKKAQRARMKRAAWRVGAGVVGGFGAVSLAVTILVLLLVSPGVLASLGTLAAVSVPLIVAALAWRKAQGHTGELNQSLDEAWALVAADVLHDKGEELSATELGNILRVQESDAEQLLAQLNVNDFIRARVTDTGELVYSSALAKLRVAEEDTDAAVIEQAEEEQAAEASEKPGLAREKNP